MKSKIVFFLFTCILFSINDAYAQKGQDENDEVVVTTGINFGRILRMENMYIFNGTVVKDSLISASLLKESKNFKTKVKKKLISDEIANELQLDINRFTYRFIFVEIKNAILDPETMKLIRIK